MAKEVTRKENDVEGVGVGGGGRGTQQRETIQNNSKDYFLELLFCLVDVVFKSQIYEYICHIFFFLIAFSISIS